MSGMIDRLVVGPSSTVIRMSDIIMLTTVTIILLIFQILVNYVGSTSPQFIHLYNELGKVNFSHIYISYVVIMFI